MVSKNSRARNTYKPTTAIWQKRVKNKKETLLIEVPKDAVIGEYLNGFEVIKPVKKFGKYYVLVKNKDS